MGPSFGPYAAFVTHGLLQLVAIPSTGTEAAAAASFASLGSEVHTGSDASEQRLKAEPLKRASEWIEGYRQFWEESFDRLETYLAELQEKEQTNVRRPRKK